MPAVPAERGAPPVRLLLQLWGGVLFLYAVLILRAGARTGPDTQSYSHWADQLIAHGFNPSSFLREESFVAPLVFYIGWIAVVAVMKVALGGGWMTGILILNWLSLGAGSYRILNVVRDATASAGSLIFAALLMCGAAELLILAPFVLSDLAFWALASAVLAAGCAVAMADDDGRRRFPARTAAIGSVLVLIAFTVRPVALPLLIFWIVALACWYARPLVDRFATAIMVAIAVLAVVVMAWHAYILMHPEEWPIGKLPEIFALLAREYRQGVLVYAPESDFMVEPATTWLSAMRMTAQKLIFFLTPWLPYYSRAHTLINFAFFIPVYGLTIATLINRNRLAPAQQRVVVVLFVYSVCLTVFHATVMIDYDHRYRLPLLPALITMAAIGLEAIRRPRRLS